MRGEPQDPETAEPLATGTGVNVSKENVYAVVALPSGIDVSKENAYAVLVPFSALSVSRENAYAIILPPPTAASVSVTQDVLETVESPTNTQVWTTQAAFEAIELPGDTKLQTTQVCLEVVLSGSWCPPCPDTGPGTGGKRNHSFIGIMALNA